MKFMSQGLFQKCIRRFIIRSRRHEVGYLSCPFVLEFGRRLSTFSTCKITKRCGYFNTQSHKFGTLRDLTIRRLICYQIIAFAQLYVNDNFYVSYHFPDWLAWVSLPCNIMSRVQRTRRQWNVNMKSTLKIFYVNYLLLIKIALGEGPFMNFSYKMRSGNEFFLVKIPPLAHQHIIITSQYNELRVNDCGLWSTISMSMWGMHVLLGLIYGFLRVMGLYWIFILWL